MIRDDESEHTVGSAGVCLRLGGEMHHDALPVIYFALLLAVAMMVAFKWLQVHPV
jgi:hypothetical protein